MDEWLKLLPAFVVFTSISAGLIVLKTDVKHINKNIDEVKKDIKEDRKKVDKMGDKVAKLEERSMTKAFQVMEDLIKIAERHKNSEDDTNG